MNMSGMQCSVNCLPIITEDHLIYFATHCKNSKKLQHDTIKMYIAGIRYHYLRAGHNDPTAGTERLPYIMRGIKKSQHNVSRNRLPITSDVLKRLCNLLSTGVFSPFIDLMLQCAFLTAFFGFLRCGEFTCKTKDDYLNCVVIDDVKISLIHDRFVLKLRTSKTDPFRVGVDITINENDIFGPVHVMNKYLKYRLQMGALASFPLFVESEFDLSRPLSRETFINYLRQLLIRLGYRESDFCGHSFRIGAATSAAAAGVEDHIIQTLGRWSSDCYIRYIRTDKRVISKAQQKMCHF
ncbi:uncharacterized protein LOC127709732 [Mytilus californianus]|uniref:uncharacterized protein LOC127709732 n=1 Tax=Mytilus californianus TaxID=6549 RepID=UPI002245629F|nr:uncharacterized protein LOC127709732 [Mytilus californianus]XP_052071363.1 uncharacterized protein LOC127709732 [Mytilus californianus]